jgi:hypothetical protein
MQRYAKSGLYSIVAGDVTYINYDEGKGIGPAPTRPKPILRKAIITAWPKRHAAMQAHRKLGPWKDGATGRIKAVIAKIEWLAARTRRAR